MTAATDSHAAAGPAAAASTAAASTATASAGPVVQDARIDSIDVLRGFALLGILVMNIQLFAMPSAAYFNPTAYGDLEGTNLYVWLGSRLFADQKFMTIFSMLFGAGIVLMATRAERSGEAARVHYRRMGWLALIGLLHAHLLWAGDILFLYAVCGMLVYPLRRMSPRLLLLTGMGIVAAGSVVYFVGGLTSAWPNEALREFIDQEWQPAQPVIDAELAAYRGGWLEQLPFRSASALAFETVVILLWGAWRAGGLMLVGMALFKLGVFSAQRAPRVYAPLIAVALLLAIPLEAYGVVLDFRYGWSIWSFFQGEQFNYWPSIAVSLGYLGLVMLACRTAALRRATRPFAAVGQMALSNYLLQTVICTTIFYGHGFGLFGSVDRLGQFGVVVAVSVVQLAWSPLWLQRFRFGPAEWVWRSLTYGVRQPLRRAPAPAT